MEALMPTLTHVSTDMLNLLLRDSMNMFGVVINAPLFDAVNAELSRRRDVARA